MGTPKEELSLNYLHQSNPNKTLILEELETCKYAVQYQDIKE